MREIFNLTPKDASTPSQLISDSQKLSPCDCEEDLLVADCMSGLCAELDENNNIIYRLPYDVAGKRIIRNGSFPNSYKITSLATFTGGYFSELLPRVSDKIEEQRIGFTAVPINSGFFTLTFNGATTSGIGWNDNENSVLNALEALPTIGIGNIKVVKLNNSSSFQQWKLFFINQLAGQNVSQTIIDTKHIYYSGIKTDIQVTDRQGSKSHSMDTTYYDTDSNYIYSSGYASIGRKSPCILEVKLNGFSNSPYNRRCDDCADLNGTYYAYASNYNSNSGYGFIQHFNNDYKSPISDFTISPFIERNKSLYGLQNQYLGGYWKTKLCTNYNLKKYGCGLASRQTFNNDVGINIALSYDISHLSDLGISGVNFSKYAGKSGICPQGYFSYCPILKTPQSGVASIYLNAFLTALNPYSGCGYKTLIHYRAKVGNAVFIGYSGLYPNPLTELYTDENFNERLNINKNKIERQLIHFSGVIVNSDVNCQSWNNVELNFYKRRMYKKVPYAINSHAYKVVEDYGKLDAYHVSGIIQEKYLTYQEYNDTLPWCNLGSITISSTDTSYYKSSTNVVWNSGFIPNYGFSQIAGINDERDLFENTNLIFDKTNSYYYFNKYFNFKSCAGETLVGFKPSGYVDIHQIPNNFYVSINGIKNSGCRSCEVLNDNFILGKRITKKPVTTTANFSEYQIVWESTFSKFYQQKYKACHHKKVISKGTEGSDFLYETDRCYENHFANLKFTIIPSGSTRYDGSVSSISGYYFYLDLENKHYQYSFLPKNTSIGTIDNYKYPYKIARWQGFLKAGPNSLDPYSFMRQLSGIDLLPLHPSSYPPFPAEYKEINSGASGICDFSQSKATIHPYVTSPVYTHCTPPEKAYANFNDGECVSPEYILVDIDRAALSGLYRKVEICCGGIDYSKYDPITGTWGCKGGYTSCDTKFIDGPYLLRKIIDYPIKDKSCYYSPKDGPTGVGNTDKLTLYEWVFPNGRSECTPYSTRIEATVIESGKDVLCPWSLRFPYEYCWQAKNWRYPTNIQTNSACICYYKPTIYNSRFGYWEYKLDYCAPNPSLVKCTSNVAPYRIQIQLEKEFCQKTKIKGTLNGSGCPDFTFLTGALSPTPGEKAIFTMSLPEQIIENINLEYNKCYLPSDKDTIFCNKLISNDNSISSGCIKITPIW